MANKKRQHNAFAIEFRRGRPAGYQHNELIKHIVQALYDKARAIWYDHIYLPAQPLTMSPMPMRIEHFSPSPDIVLKLHDDSYWMIHIQRVYPIKRPSRLKIPNNLKTKQNGKNTDT